MIKYICLHILILGLFSIGTFAQWVELAEKNGLPAAKSEYYTNLVIDGNNIAISTFGNKVYVSKDAGDNWVLTQYTPSQNRDTYLCGIKDSNIFATIYEDYLVSHDYGQTWKVFTDTSHSVSGTIMFTGETGIIGGCCSLYRTTDYGETFQRVIATGWSNDGYGPLLVKGNSLFSAKFIGREIYRSIDKGQSWDAVYAPTNNKYSSYLSINDLIMGFEYQGNSVISSSDNGTSWSETPNYAGLSNFRQIISCGNNLFGISINQIGVYQSRDSGKKWLSANTGLAIEHGKSGLAIAHNEKYIYILYGGTLCRAKLINCEIDFSNDAGENLASENAQFISPNPASDFIDVFVGANGRSPLQSDVRIYNVYGQTVLSIGAIHELPLRVDISGFAPGMYFVRIGDIVGKFVKL